MNFQEQFYKFRKEKRLSQEQLAEKLGVSRQAISKWENGSAMPETEKLVTISEYFGVSMDVLLGKKEVENKDRIKSLKTKHVYLGIALVAFSAILLVLWGLMMIVNPNIITNIGASSTITLNGNFFLCVFCIMILLLGVLLILKDK